jgi:hypothetical protein
MCQMLCRTVLCSKKEIQDKERALRRSIHNGASGPHNAIALKKGFTYIYMRVILTFLIFYYIRITIYTT